MRICGEISSNPFYAVLLLGMGFTQLSMNPLSIPTIRRVLREIPMEDSRQIAQKALTFITAAGSLRIPDETPWPNWFPGIFRPMPRKSPPKTDETESDRRCGFTIF